jgi:hypothetical protein
VAAKEIRVCRVDVASLHPAQKGSVAAYTPKQESLCSRNHIANKLRCRCHRLFEEINDNGVEPFSQSWEPSECLLYTIWDTSNGFQMYNTKRKKKTTDDLGQKLS